MWILPIIIQFQGKSYKKRILFSGRTYSENFKMCYEILSKSQFIGIILFRSWKQLLKKLRRKAEWHIENEGDVFVSLKFIIPTFLFLSGKYMYSKGKKSHKLAKFYN